MFWALQQWSLSISVKLKSFSTACIAMLMYVCICMCVLYVHMCVYACANFSYFIKVKAKTLFKNFSFTSLPLSFFFNYERTLCWKDKNANSTWGSQAVTHPSTNQAQCCLTSVIGRELVFSTWYGRCRESGVNWWLYPHIFLYNVVDSCRQAKVRGYVYFLN